jgi:hypothetical protein
MRGSAGLNQTFQLDREGSVFELPIPHVFLKWAGINPTFGHLFSLVNERGQRDKSIPGYLVKKSESHYEIRHFLPIPVIQLFVREDNGKYVVDLHT